MNPTAIAVAPLMLPMDVSDLRCQLKTPMALCKLKTSGEDVSSHSTSGPFDVYIPGHAPHQEGNRPMLSTQPSRRNRHMASALCWVMLVGQLATAAPALAADLYRWVDDQGRVHLTDTPPQSMRDRQELKVYAPGERPVPPDRHDSPAVAHGRAKQVPTQPGGVIMVEAVLNRHLTVPLLLDTGADLTVLTRQVAADLRIRDLGRLPTLPFRTAAGMVTFPITTLQSLRVGTAEVQHVHVAIDVNGHLPVGLLGMSFLHHFKVTVDQQRGQVTFER